jgi:hypothetical protein
MHKLGTDVLKWVADEHFRYVRRGDAVPTQDQLVLELQYVDTDEFATPLTRRCCPSGQPVSLCSALAAL